MKFGNLELTLEEATYILTLRMRVKTFTEENLPFKIERLLQIGMTNREELILLEAIKQEQPQLFEEARTTLWVLKTMTVYNELNKRLDDKLAKIRAKVKN